MGRPQKITGVLTSSRADYGIYRPLLRALSEDPAFDLRILVFGTHLSERYGMTVRQIEEDGFPVEARVDTMPAGDSPGDIARSMAMTIERFSAIWKKSTFDVIIALGDRYEMFAAVASLMPFNIPVAHIHGGETTLGAIDNRFRHAITAMSTFHFPVTESYAARVAAITGNTENIYCSGALSVDAIQQTQLLTVEEIRQRLGVNMSLSTLLVTFHPETADPGNSRDHITELLSALEMIEEQIIITMPNADAEGLTVRNEIESWATGRRGVYIFESLGSQAYLSCMSHCRAMVGNSSSGFIEAACFSLPVVNVGERQRGRILTPNICQVPVKRDMIVAAIRRVLSETATDAGNIYGNGDAAKRIVAGLRQGLKITG